MLLLSIIYNKSYRQIAYDIKEQRKVYAKKRMNSAYLEVAKLKIPSINLKENLYKDSRNTINYGLEIMYEDDNQLLIVGHSGSGPLAKFKNLSNIKIGAKLYITKERTIKMYTLNNVSKLLKTSNIKLKQTHRKKVYLVTCSQYDKKYFLVFQFNEI